MSEDAYRLVVTKNNKTVRVKDDGLKRVHKADIQRVCESITKKPDGFNFMGTTPDYTLVARTLGVDPAALQEQYQRGCHPDADSDDRWCFEKLDMACSMVEMAMVLEWRSGRAGPKDLLETYFRKYSKTYRQQMELELNNVLHTVRQLVDEPTYCKVLNALRSQDPSTQALETYGRVQGAKHSDDDAFIDVEDDDD